jgi:hypothetical protein
MIYFIFILGGLFVLVSFPMLYVFYREKHFGIFLMGITYGLSGLLAITLPHWWPLVVGFVVVWLLRLIGMEPAIPAPGDGGAGSEKSKVERRKSEGAESKAEGESRKSEG